MSPARAPEAYPPRVKGVRFGISVPRFLLARTLGRVSDAFLFGAPSGLSLVALPSRALPGPRWARLAPIAAGVCGSDLAMLAYENSPALEPFTSFPAVLGHENVARVIEVGPEVTRVRAGDRVVVDPTLSCEARGFPDACPSCAAGLHATCARMGDRGPTIGRGMFVGAHAELPGGFGTEMVCHESQLFVVPGALGDDVAVLCEPLSVAMHAVLGAPRDASAALVIGSGPIALGVVWALRAAGFEGALLAQTKRRKEAELAEKLGATAAVTPSGARAALLETGARAYRPILGPEVFAGGGFPLVFDCVGTGETLRQALGWASPRGRVVLLGCAAELRKLDLTFVWARELTVGGAICYGREASGEHTYDVTLRALAETRAPVAELVTHRFPLERYREALSAAWNRAESGAVKVLLAG